MYGDGSKEEEEDSRGGIRDGQRNASDFFPPPRCHSARTYITKKGNTFSRSFPFFPVHSGSFIKESPDATPRVSREIVCLLLACGKKRPIADTLGTTFFLILSDRVCASVSSTTPTAPSRNRFSLPDFPLPRADIRLSWPSQRSYRLRRWHACVRPTDIRWPSAT